MWTSYAWPTIALALLFFLGRYFLFVFLIDLKGTSIRVQLSLKAMLVNEDLENREAHTCFLLLGFWIFQ